MPTGYLVTLGNFQLDPGDRIGGALTSFSTDRLLGAGSFTWSGTSRGYRTITNQTVTGNYYLAGDGRVFFVPSAMPRNPVITSASATSAPSYTSKDGIVQGTGGDDVINSGYTDANGDRIDGGSGTGPGGLNDLVRAGAGNDRVESGAGDDTIYGEAGNDTLIGGLGSDKLFGGLGNDELYLSQGDTADGGDGDDLFILTDLGEAGAKAIYIDGGSTGETRGDTLDLKGLADRGTMKLSAPAGTPGGMAGEVTMYDGSVVYFQNIEHIICFTPGTRILTDRGERAIEDLKAGDLIVTRDNGLQPICWLGRSTVDGRGRHAPIAVNSTVMDGARRPLLVSPQHRLLHCDHRADLLFGTPEVLLAARHLVDGRDVRAMPRRWVTYLHLMLPRHEIIYAEGAACESFHATRVSIASIGDTAREELYASMPELRQDLHLHGAAARRCLRGHEARLLLHDRRRTGERAA